MCRIGMQHAVADVGGCQRVLYEAMGVLVNLVSSGNRVIHVSARAALLRVVLSRPPRGVEQILRDRATDKSAVVRQAAIEALVLWLASSAGSTLSDDDEQAATAFGDIFAVRSHSTSAVHVRRVVTREMHFVLCDTLGWASDDSRRWKMRTRDFGK